MNFFYLIIIYGYALLAIIMIYFICRDQKRNDLFFNRYKKIAWIIKIVLLFGIILIIYTNLIEPNLLLIKETEIQSEKISQTINIVFVSDLQVGNYKKTAFVEKLVKKIDSVKPDLILIGGDLIDNEGTFEDESKYLEPLKILKEKYPIYYILGNHE